DTLRFLLPGFVLVKLFYQFGVRTKRTDADWLLWGILASAPIDLIVSTWIPLPRSSADSGGIRLGAALLIAVALGIAAACLWKRMLRRWPSISVSFSPRAWEQVLQQSRWLQVETSDKHTFIGYAKYVAHSVDTDDL